LKRYARSVLICALLGMITAPACRAADITAEQSALLYDLLDPLAKDSVPKTSGTDPEVLGRAVGILKDEKLAGQGGRPNFNEPGLLDKYGKALFLGTRAREFAPEIGRIHDLVASGQNAQLEQALSDLWVKAGRSKPDAKALAPVIASLYDEQGQQPMETVHHTFDRPDSHIDVKHARAGGLMQVDVTTKNPDGSDKERTSIQGTTETTPTPGGDDLQRRIKLDKVCTSTPATDRATLEKLNGEWKAQGNGRTWTISVEDSKVVTLDETREGFPPLRYSGTYHLGKIAAVHTISKVTDMEDNLPMAVRQQLLGMNVSFRVNLEFCGDAAGSLKGTWSSQHVTYNGMSETVKRIHDPYDLSLVLGKGGAMKVAEGAARNEPL
jgi:hypothetical protein